jgi:hypothetical protein
MAQKADHYMLSVRIKMRSGAYASSRQDTHYTGGGGSQEFMGAVDYTKSGCPDIDARTSRFKSLSHLLGPLGRRVPAPRLQQRLMRL